MKDLMEGGKNIKDAMLFNVLSYISHALISGGNTAGIIDELHVFLSNPLDVYKRQSPWYTSTRKI